MTLQPVLYCDIDGVIAPDSPPRVWPGETTTVTLTQKVHGGFGMIRRATFANTLVQALDQVVRDFNVELVWQSSWNENLAVTRKLVPKFGGALAGGRVSAYPDGEDGEGGFWKRDGILTDQDSDPRPFVWLDDTEVPAHGDTVRTITAPTPSLLIAPDSNLGLTPTHVELLREFYSAVA